MNIVEQPLVRLLLQQLQPLVRDEAFGGTFAEVCSYANSRECDHQRGLELVAGVDCLLFRCVPHTAKCEAFSVPDGLIGRSAAKGD